jgi:hypothetical protein
MKKLNLWLFASLFVAAFTLAACGSDGDDTPPPSGSDIQGNWYWYMDNDNNNIAGAMIIRNNEFDLIIGAWGQKYSGTYTYQSGVMKLHITKGRTSRAPHTGYGVGYGNMDPETLDATWSILDREYWDVEADMTMKFVVSGNQADSEFANRSIVYYKKDRTPKVNPTETLIGTKWYETENSSPEDKIYMTWVYENGKANWGNLVWSTENIDTGRWEKLTRHSYTLTVDGCDFTLTSGEGVKRTGSYVINGDEMTIWMGDEEMHLIRIKGDLLNTWNNATEVEI